MHLRAPIFFTFVVILAACGSNDHPRVRISDAPAPSVITGETRPLCSDECAAPPSFPGATNDSVVPFPDGTRSEDGGLSLEPLACDSEHPVIAPAAPIPCARFEYSTDGGVLS